IGDRTGRQRPVARQQLRRGPGQELHERGVTECGERRRETAQPDVSLCHVLPHSRGLMRCRRCHTLTPAADRMPRTLPVGSPREHPRHHPPSGPCAATRRQGHWPPFWTYPRTNSSAFSSSTSSISSSIASTSSVSFSCRSLTSSEPLS